MTNIAGRLNTALTAAGVLVAGVSIGDPVDKKTWTVSPLALQAKAQPIIDAFDLTAPDINPRELAPLEFARRFTDVELVAFEMLCAGIDANAAAARVAKMKLALVRERVHLDHADTIKYLGLLATMGILTPARVIEIRT